MSLEWEFWDHIYEDGRLIAIVYWTFTVTYQPDDKGGVTYDNSGVKTSGVVK